MVMLSRVAKTKTLMEACVHAFRGLFKKIMKTLKFILLALITIASTSQAFAACDYPGDRAADGSRCGGRASSERPGGK
jgi:hypothetical protein